MKLTLIAFTVMLALTGCASNPNYACSKGNKSSSCQSLSQTAKQTSHSLPSRVETVKETDLEVVKKQRVTIAIPKPKQGTYVYADEVQDEIAVDSRVEIISNASANNKPSNLADITTKKNITPISFENDVENMRNGAIQSNNKLAYVNPGTPLLTEPWVVNIYFTPYVNSYGDLDTGGNVYMKIQDSEWVLQR